MGRTRLLTIFKAAIAAADFETYSWGPFRGTLRIHRFWMRSGDTAATRTSAGLFIANSDDRPTGVFSGSFTGFPGWTAVHEAGDFTPGNQDDRISVFLPFQAPSADGYVIGQGAHIDVTADLFFLKLLVRNQTGGGISLHAHLIVEENPADADGGQIDVREPPADGSTPRPPGTPSPPAPAPPTPTAPPPAGLPPASLPPPLPGAFPAIVIDPHDPLTSALEPV